MAYSAPSPLGPARPSVADIEAAKPTIRSLGKLGKPFSFFLYQCPPNRSICNMDALRALQLMGGVFGVTLALRGDHVDGSGTGAESD
jgi:chromosome partitioning protein